MTAPLDEKDEELEEYLSRRSEVSRRYRSSATEEPPAELDRAVLSQAHAAVKGTSSNVSNFPKRRTRWMVPFAVAATVLLSFAIFRDAGIGTGVKLQESSALNTQFVEEREAKAADEVQEPVTVTLNSDTADRADRPPPPPSPAIELPVAPASAPPPEVVVIQPAPAPAPAPARNAIQVVTNQRPPAAAEAKDTTEARKESRTPEVWLEDIRKLRAADKTAEADAELLLFTAAYPDYFEKNPGVPRP